MDSRSRASAAGGFGALLIAGVFVGSCAFAEAALVDTATQAVSAVSAVPAPSYESAARGTTFETQNGTLRVELPNGWIVDDASTALENYDQQMQWSNILTLQAPNGTTLRYYDGFGDATDSGWGDYEVVQTQETPTGQWAIAYWRETILGVTADVVLGTIDESGQPLEHFMFDGTGRTHVMGMVPGNEVDQQFETEAEAEAFLASPAVQEAFAIVASVRLHPVPQYAMPDGLSTAAADSDPPERS